MEWLWIVGVGLVGVAALGAAMYGAFLAAKKRTEGMYSAAVGLSFAFDPAPTMAAIEHLSELPIFNRGHSKKVVNLLTGSAKNVRIAIFDYHYTTGSGKHKHVHKQTLVAADSERLSLPHFELSPESFVHRIAAMFGYQDIDFMERPLFSKMFLLRGTPEEEVRAVFDDRLFEFFEAQKDITVQAAGNSLAYFRQDKLHDPAKLADLLKDGFAAYSLFKNGG